MFYNIYLQEEFRYYYRFLWNFDANANEPKVYRFSSITMGAKDSPFYSNSHHTLPPRPICSKQSRKKSGY